MILPGKHLSPSRSLLGVGGEILAQLARPQEVTDLWNAFRAARRSRERNEPVSFDWFVTALTFLYAIDAIHMIDGAIMRGNKEP
jgi:hypothetical protein